MGIGWLKDLPPVDEDQWYWFSIDASSILEMAAIPAEPASFGHAKCSQKRGLLLSINLLVAAHCCFGPTAVGTECSSWHSLLRRSLPLLALPAISIDPVKAAESALLNWLKLALPPNHIAVSIAIPQIQSTRRCRHSNRKHHHCNFLIRPLVRIQID